MLNFTTKFDKWTNLDKFGKYVFSHVKRKMEKLWIKSVEEMMNFVKNFEKQTNLDKFGQMYFYHVK